MMQVEEVFREVAQLIEADAAAWDQRREQTTLPRITLTYAQSIDGSIAAERGKPTLLSGSASMKMTHLLRTLHDGIMVGIGTILADNPSLNARLMQGKNPKPIIVDTYLRCPIDIKLFTNPTCEKPILLCSTEVADQDFLRRKTALEEAGARILQCRTQNSSHHNPIIALRDAFERLRCEGIASVMIEGGASIILGSLRESARAHFIDRVVVTVAPTFDGNLQVLCRTQIGGLHAVGHRVSAEESPRLLEPMYRTLDDDVVIFGKL